MPAVEPQYVEWKHFPENVVPRRPGQRTTRFCLVMFDSKPGILYVLNMFSTMDGTHHWHDPYTGELVTEYGQAAWWTLLGSMALDLANALEQLKNVKD